MSADWADPAYVAAKRAKAAAYAEFCTVAGTNPHIAGKPEWFEFYKVHVQPLRQAFLSASERWRVEIARVIQEGEAA